MGNPGDNFVIHLYDSDLYKNMCMFVNVYVVGPECLLQKFINFTHYTQQLAALLTVTLWREATY